MDKEQIIAPKLFNGAIIRNIREEKSRMNSCGENCVKKGITFLDLPELLVLC